MEAAIRYGVGLVAKGKGSDHPGLKIGMKVVGNMMRDMRESNPPPEVMKAAVDQLTMLMSWVGSGVRDPSIDPWPEELDV